MENLTNLNSSIPEVEASDELITDELGDEDLEQVSGGVKPLLIGAAVGVGVGLFAYGAYKGYKEGEAEEAAQCRCQAD